MQEAEKSGNRAHNFEGYYIFFFFFYFFVRSVAFLSGHLYLQLRMRLKYDYGRVFVGIDATQAQTNLMLCC